MAMYMSNDFVKGCIDNHINLYYKNTLVTLENMGELGLSGWNILTGYSIILESQDGYSFSKPPTIGLSNSGNSSYGATQIIENKKYSFSQYTNNVGITKIYPNIISGEVIKPCYKFYKADTDKLLNAKLKLYINGVLKPYFNQAGGSPYEVFPNDLIEIKTDENYLTIDSFKLDNDSFIISNNVASLVLPEKVYTGFTFTFTYRPPRYTFNEVDSNKLIETHSILKLNNVPMVIGQNAYDGDIFHIETVGRYEFLEAPYFAVNTGVVSQGSYRFLLDSKMLGNLHITEFDENKIDKRQLSRISIFTIQKDDAKGLNNLFKIDNDQMRMINVERFQPIDIEGNTTDYGVNIIGLVNLPFEVDSSYLLNPENILLGTLSTNVTAPKIKSDRYIYSFGDITVPSGASLLDYENTKAILYLPYTDPMELPLDFVLGFIIQVEYVIDLYSGQADVNVLSSKNNEVFTTKNVNLGIRIPHSGANGDKQFAENINIVMGGDNFIRKPFIEIQKYNPILADGIFSNLVEDEKTLLDEKGFLEVDKIQLESSATSEEKRLIVTALKSGVIIK